MGVSRPKRQCVNSVGLPVKPSPVEVVPHNFDDSTQDSHESNHHEELEDSTSPYSVENDIPKVGDRYMVRYKDTFYSGEILQVRNKKDTSDYEFYIHYDGMKRLDRWVERTEIDENQRLLNDHDDSNIINVDSNRKLTRNQRRKHDAINHVQKSFAEMDPTTAALEREHYNITKIKYIDRIQLGGHEIEAWYFSPYPSNCANIEKLWICDFCLRYMTKETTYRHHQIHCQQRKPPGDEIYRKGTLSVYEINGEDHRVYCQCLCLLAKLFLDHKTLFFDVQEFRFYIITEVDQTGARIVGFFSKEKNSLNNLACILTLPPHQKKGYGKFMIALSYELSKIDGLIGSPEKPLSDLGKLTYLSYWSYVLLTVIRDKQLNTIPALSKETSIMEADIIMTLQSLNLSRYWRGTHVVYANLKTVSDHLNSPQFRPPSLWVDSTALRYSAKPSLKKAIPK